VFSLGENKFGQCGKEFSADFEDKLNILDSNHNKNIMAPFNVKFDSKIIDIAVG
jgi:hypothetical protein